MKLLHINYIIILAALFMWSCEKESNDFPKNIDETENLKFIESFTEQGHTIELFNPTGQLKVGYNKIFLRITDDDQRFVESTTIQWMPLMNMKMGETIHQHSCPHSEITKVNGKETLFEGDIIFIMASDEPDHYWNLEIEFSVDGQSFKASKNVSVISTESEFNKVYTSGTGLDGATYMLALVEPAKPQIGTNDIIVALYKNGDHHDFQRVDHFKIRVDPRMPGMGNHGSPGNEDMTQKTDGFYHGKVGFSMSGYWKINLILEDESGTIIKGNPVIEEDPESSLNFKLEF